MTKNFTLAELTATGTGLHNIPTPAQIECLELLAAKVLQPLRDKYGKPIKINSGFRCPQVNAAVGGKPTSQHTTGQAADITGGSKDENKKLFEILKTMDFDQLIDENNMSWIHVSYKAAGNRKQILKL